MTTSLRPLLVKELVDLARNRIAFVPVLIAAGVAIVMPFLVVVVMPIASGHSLGSDSDLLKVSIVTGIHDELGPDGRVQVFLFQQFLMLFLLLPVTGAMSLAAHAVVGEKQARTLEPLLATPVTTLELLVAKVLGALAPTLAIAVAGLVLYFAGIAIAGGPGVMQAMVTARTFVLVFLVGPASALVALQAAVLISSRVNDARTAQQFGVLIILPMTALLVAQFTGSLWLSAWRLGLIGVGLLVAWVLLVLFSVAMFEREAILTRWT
jgi:ABC-2 type transport system permease protein